MIERFILDNIEKKLFSGKLILLLGARQVGKSTLLEQLASRLNLKPVRLNGDIARDRALLKNLTPERARQLFPKGSLVFIDEAQRLENTGLSLKIIHDHCPEIQVIATGSSSFELSDKLREPLTGRKWTFYLFPIAQLELAEQYGRVATIQGLESRLIYGSYPDVITREGYEEDVLQELTSDYLYKDVFSLGKIRRPEGLEKLVQALAFQVGNEVSFRELSVTTGLDKETVERYIILLEEAFVIFRLTSYAKNLRNELKRARKVYFWDNGIRNAVIGQFAPIGLRNDMGALWENFLISERQKAIHYKRKGVKPFFWRTASQQKIDYLEVQGDKIEAFEMKWNPRKKVKIPLAFENAYPDVSFSCIHSEEYLDFALGES